MNNTVVIISGILALGSMIFFYWKRGDKLSNINFWRLIQELIVWSVATAFIYIIIEFIFLKPA